MYWNAVPTEEKQTISLVWESEAIQMMVGLDLRLVFFELVITLFFLSSLVCGRAHPFHVSIIAYERAYVYHWGLDKEVI